MPSRAMALPPALVERLRGVDMILHAGDLTTTAILKYLQTMAPVAAVSGNVDDLEIKQLLPMTRIVRAGHFQIGMVHGDGSGLTTIERARRVFSDVDCIVFGHS